MHLAGSASFALWTAIVLLTAGCGAGGSGRVPVTGRVTQKGQPVRSGFISFTPAEGSSGPAANADIRDGGYRFTYSDGPGVGPYHVTINISAIGSKAAGAAPRVEPRRWDFDVVVTAEGSDPADFELESP